MTETIRRPGRPPSASTRSAILDATVALLVEEGYAGLTMDAVAARACASKATIYRHWDGKPELVIDAVREFAPPLPEGSAGNLRDDLVTLVGGMIASFRDTPTGQTILAVLEGARRDPRLAALHHEMVAPRKAYGRSLVRAAIERGELPADLDPELATEILVGPIFFRVIISHDALDDGLAERLVDLVLNGLRAG